MLIFSSIFCATDKPPPTINVNRDWTIPDTAAIGTVITNVELISEDNSEFEFGLEQGNGPFRNTNPSEPLPFTINEKTGEVVTNQSLINMVNFNIEYTNYVLLASLSRQSRQLLLNRRNLSKSGVQARDDEQNHKLNGGFQNE